MKHVFLLMLWTLVSCDFARSQNLDYVKDLIDTLCAPGLHGRGYVEYGDAKAAEFIMTEAKKLWLEPMGPGYEQTYGLAVNTFPGNMSVIVDDEKLIPGVDYLINPASKGVKAELQLVYVKPAWAGSREKLFKLKQKYDLSKCALVFEEPDHEDAAYESLISSLPQNPLKAAAYLVLTSKKLTWSVSTSTIETTILQVKSEVFSLKAKTLVLDIDQKFISRYKTMNVLAEIPGESDSTIVFSAHYDHLGRMGRDMYIPGASDNASGTAMLFDLAKYYLENPSKYTVQFMWFSGEEAGLLGSTYYVKHPVDELKKIKFLLNLDLMADAKKGITVVNGKVYSSSFDRLAAINEEMGLLNKVNARGAAANSDHYPFSQMGVPSFFIYTIGDYKHYHDINDKAEHVPMTNYENVFRLITSFVEKGL